MKVKDVTVSGSLRCFHADLATWLGINPALVFERLRYLFDYEGNGRMLNGHRWIFNSYPQWQKNHFPWMCERNVQYAFRVLEQKGLVVSIQPDGASRKKYYRIADGAMDVEISHDADSASSNTQDLRLPNTSIDVSHSSFPKGKACPSEDFGPVDGFANLKQALEGKTLNPSILAPKAQSGTPNPPVPRTPLSPKRRGAVVPYEKPDPEVFDAFIEYHGFGDYIDSGIQYRKFSNPKAKMRWDTMKNWKTVTKRLHEKIEKDKTDQ